jgi:putative transposase
MHKKTYRYRLRPTKPQETLLEQTLDECRWLYNHLLEQRKAAYEERSETLSLYDQLNTRPALKIDRPELARVHSQVLQNVATRLDLAMGAFFRWVRAGESSGYPRFRGRGRYNSFCYPQSGFKLTETDLYLSKIGHVKVILHRPAEGTFKTCCISRTSTGKWFVTFSCDADADPLPAVDTAVGIDVGLASFSTMSDGSEIENPRFVRKDETDLRRVQRLLSKEAKGTPGRRKRRKALARVHERISNRRTNFAHQHSRKIVNRFATIAVEKLAINNMVHNHCLAKSIQDAAWNQFIQYLAYKAEWAGRKVILVNPAYTSQTCSNPTCGHRQSTPLAVRIFECPCCHLVLYRDVNAARNILRLGLQSLQEAQTR